MCQQHINAVLPASSSTRLPELQAKHTPDETQQLP
jgi:hypothetical protein